MNTVNATTVKKSNAKKSTKKNKDTVPVQTPAPVPVNITAKAITNTTMVIKIKKSKFAGRLNDKDLTAASCAQHNINNGEKVISVIKRICRGPKLNNIFNLDQKLDKYIRSVSRPWQDGGVRCFPAIQFPTVKENVDKLLDERAQAVENFLSSIKEIIDHDKAVLKSAFDITDYPNVDELRTKFGARVEYDKITDYSDFRVDGLSEETLTQLRDDMAKQFEERMRAGDADLLERLLNGDAPAANDNRGNGLRNLLYRLTTPNDKGEIGFKQTSLDNIREFAEQAVQLNIGNNKTISDICAKLQKVFAVEADTLRENETALNDKAAETKAAIAEIENAMAGLV